MSSTLPISIILDCNLWIDLIRDHPSGFRSKLLSGRLIIIISSYMAVEILRTLRRLAGRIDVRYKDLADLFWHFVQNSCIKVAFQQPLSESLVRETRNIPEMQIIAKMLGLEVKDVPYIVCAYEHSAILVTIDYRSILNKREIIEDRIGVLVIDKDELSDKFF